MIDPPSRSLRDKCLEVKDKVDAFLAEEPDTQLLRDVQAQLRVSIEVVEEALDKYGPEQISLSYNGGKDCLVLLIVILSCLGRRYSTSSATNGTSKSSYLSLEKIQAVYIVAAHPFPEIDSFVESSSAEYSLEVARYVLPMKKGLEIYLEERPSVQAIFVGTRRTDPHGEKLRHFDPTDKGWPSFMRVHPVIDWHYGRPAFRSKDMVMVADDLALQRKSGPLSDTWEFRIVLCMTRAIRVWVGKKTPIRILT
ncbi:hypothetical protein ACJZ2D_013618 [Fusarium nematophilum]